MGTKIKLSRQELNWIERTADIGKGLLEDEDGK
jgi:hypothetical protein